MSPFAVLSLLSALSCGLLAAFIHVRVSRSLDAKLFSLLLILMTAEALLEFAYRTSGSEAEALVCWKLNGHWPFILAVLLHFAVVSVDRQEWAHKPLVLVLIYAPALCFSLIEWSVHWVTGPPIHAWWGWTYGPPLSRDARPAAFVWVLSTIVVSWLITFVAWYRAPPSAERNRFGWTHLGLAIALTASLAETVLSLFQLSIPPLTVPTYALMVLPIGYGIIRYEVFELTPVVASEGIIETMADALFLVGPDGKVLFGNRAAVRALGASKRQLVGRPLSSVLASKPPWLRSLARGNLPPNLVLPNVETSLLAEPGNRIPVLVAGSAILSLRGKLRGVVVIARDISSQKRANEELHLYKEHLEELVQVRTQEILAKNQQLEQAIDERRSIEQQAGELEAQLQQAQKMEAVGRLAGGIAHDFNNLLTGILGFAELIFASMSREDERREDVSEILLAANRAGQLVQQLLAFSRKQPIERRIVDLDKLIGSLKQMLSRIIGDDVSLVVRRGDGVHFASVDPGQFEQILVNLVVNARDAMPHGGVIEIATDVVTLERGACPIHSDLAPGQYVQVMVRDSGEGMSPETKSKIFEPFFTTKSPGKGTGLGLSTVYGLVQQNAGCIQLESELGRGTDFFLLFPRTTGDTLSTQPPPTRLGSGGREVILVVEDEPSLRRLATRVLGRQGYRVHTAPDAVEALRKLKELGSHIDLLLTDMVMPGPSGRELATEVSKRCPSARILFMSGYSSEKIQTEAEATDESRILRKPFSAEALLERVRSILDQHAPAGNRL